MPNQGALLFFYAQTPLHVGGSQELGAVDLPLQRERMSGLPVVAGSGIKGALRQELRDHWQDPDGKRWQEGKESVHFALFGPEAPEKGSASWAGALTLVDARLLLFPIRSLRGGWAWLTSPFILERLSRDLETLGQPADWSAGGLLPASNDRALVTKESILHRDRALIVEDLQYEANSEKSDEVGRLAAWLAGKLPQSPAYQGYGERLKKQLAIVSDQELADLTNQATEIVTRTRIDEKTGTVKSGQLWTEEVLPAETLLWSLALVVDDRRPDEHRPKVKRSEKEVPEDRIKSRALHADLVGAIAERKRIRLGGDQSVGRGLVGIRAWVEGK